MAEGTLVNHDAVFRNHGDNAGNDFAGDRIAQDSVDTGGLGSRRNCRGGDEQSDEGDRAKRLGHGPLWQFPSPGGFVLA